MNNINENLSKQLCEICGLPYEKEIENELYRNMCNNGDPRCTQINRTNKATLDFEQPENFVKLLNIFKTNKLSIILAFDWCSIDTRLFDPSNDYDEDDTFKFGGEHFLKAIQDFFINEWDIKAGTIWNKKLCDENITKIKKFREDIKQAIKDEEWVYE